MKNFFRVKKKEGKAFLFFILFLTGVSVHCEEETGVLWKGLPAEEVIQEMLQQNADQSAQWLALLHVRRGGSLFRDGNFILSATHFSARAELTKTIVGLINDAAMRCRFPARLRWITHQLGQPFDDRWLQGCRGYVEYRKRAPADHISLIFASENLRNPTTMMGHAFLKIEGTGEDGQILAHTVSYYTPLESRFLPALIVKSLSVGLPGVFGLVPYRESLNRYLLREERNVWEYELALTSYQRALIHDHIWELKGVESKYHFVGHNCATLTAYLLAIVFPDVLTEDPGWQTPKNLVLNLSRHDRILRQRVHLSGKWKTMMLATRLKRSEIRRYKNNLPEETEWTGDHERDYLSMEIVNGLKRLDVSSDPKQVDQSYRKNMQEYLSRYQSIPDIDLTAFKRPDKTPPDSQYTIGFRQGRKAAWLLEFVPAAHQLLDDNRQYFSEGELRLGAFELDVEQETGDVSLHTLDLYRMRTFTAYQPIMNQYSVSFDLGYLQLYDMDLDQKGVLNLSAGIGQAYSLGNDMDVYAMLEAGGASGSGERFGYLEPKVGIIIREIWDMKSHIEWKTGLNYLKQSGGVQQIQWRQAKYFGTRHALVGGWDWVWNSRQERQSGFLGYRYYF